MEPRLDYGNADPNAPKAMLGLETYVRNSGLDIMLIELINTRASQLNGCAYCLDMHTKDARARGESEQRLYSLTAWRESPFYTDRERAALAWTEAVTLVPNGHPSDALFAEVRAHFSEAEIIHLTMAIIKINAWNRIAISFKMVPGAYVSPHKPAER